MGKINTGVIEVFQCACSCGQHEGSERCTHMYGKDTRQNKLPVENSNRKKSCTQKHTMGHNNGEHAVLVDGDFKFGFCDEMSIWGGLFLGNPWKRVFIFLFLLFVFKKGTPQATKGASQLMFFGAHLLHGHRCVPLEKRAYAIRDMANSWNAKAGGPRLGRLVMSHCQNGVTERWPFPCNAVCVFRLRLKDISFSDFLLWCFWCVVFCLHVYIGLAKAKSSAKGTFFLLNAASRGEGTSSTRRR